MGLPIWCSTPQNYKNLKAIPNFTLAELSLVGVFDTTKLQKFESNSQLAVKLKNQLHGCSTPQNYKNLKAIPNFRA